MARDGRRAPRAAVDFSIDGEVLWSDSRKPFAFAAGHGWNTTRRRERHHVLALRVTGDGRTAWKRWTVRVVNHDFALTTSKLRPWQKVAGLLRIRANVRGARRPASASTSTAR